MKKLKLILRFLLFFALGCLIIYLFQKNLDEAQKEEILQAFVHADYWWLAGGAGLLLVSHVFRTLRWKMMLQSMGYRPSFGKVFLSILVAYFANLAVPRLGEVVRCTILYQHHRIPIEKSLGTVVTERVLDLLCFFLLFLASFLMLFTEVKSYVREHVFDPLAAKGESGGTAGLIVLAVVAVLCILFFLFRKQIKASRWGKKIREILQGFWQGVVSLKNIGKKGSFWLNTAMIWVCYWGMMLAAFQSMPSTEGLGGAVGLFAMIMGTLGVILTPGGIGVYPLIMAQTLAIFSVSSMEGYAIGWLIWGLQTLLILIAGLIALLILGLLKK